MTDDWLYLQHELFRGGRLGLSAIGASKSAIVDLAGITGFASSPVMDGGGLFRKAKPNGFCTVRLTGPGESYSLQASEEEAAEIRKAWLEARAGDVGGGLPDDLETRG